MRAWLVVLLALAATGCALHDLATDVDYMRRMVRPLDCGDQLPPRVLTDPRCRDGICGVSCVPDRWRTP